MAFAKNNQNFRLKSDNKREQQSKGHYSLLVQEMGLSSEHTA